MQRLRTLVPGHLSSHSALSSYGLFAPLALWRLSVSLRSLVQTLESILVSGAPWYSTMPSSLERGRVATTTNLLLLTIFIYFFGDQLNQCDYFANFVKENQLLFDV